MGTSPRGPMVGPIVTRLIIHRNIKQPQALDQLFFANWARPVFGTSWNFFYHQNPLKSFRAQCPVQLFISLNCITIKICRILSRHLNLVIFSAPSCVSSDDRLECMSSHSFHIGRASLQCGCRNVSSDHQLEHMRSHSCHIGKASLQCGCRNVSSVYQLKCIRSHSCRIGKVSLLCGCTNVS